MGSVVLGIGASHSTLMNTNWDEVDHLREAHDFRDGLNDARDFLAKAAPDAVVIVGSNHFRGFFLDLMPTVTVGVGECLGAGEAGTPCGGLPVDTELARSVVDGLVEDGFDPAFSLRLTVDHGITHSLQYLTPELQIPIVPIVINMFAPPLPSLRRVFAMGQSVGRSIRARPDGRRVAIVASGGLSHQLPWPKWFAAMTDDDRFLVEAWLNGRDEWTQYEVRRREIIRAAAPAINSEFDRKFLTMMEAGDVSSLLDVTSDELEAQAGNGAQELRSWLFMAAAMGPFSAKSLAYAPIAEWLTGMGVLVAEPNEPVPHSKTGRRL